jgi:hypothetical protein
MKHFEQIWEEAENLTVEWFEDIAAADQMLRDNIELVVNGGRIKDFGRLLFAIAYYSKKNNINVYDALRDITEDYKIKILEDD